MGKNLHVQNLDLEPECQHSNNCKFYGPGCKFSQARQCKPDFETRFKLAKEEPCPIMKKLGYKGKSTACQFPTFRANFPGVNQCVIEEKCGITSLRDEERKKVIAENAKYIM